MAETKSAAQTAASADVGAQTAQAASSTNETTFSISTSRFFVDWLAAENVTLAVSTYQSGRLYLFGRDAQGRFAAFQRELDRAMGMSVDDKGFWIGTRHQLWRFGDATERGQDFNGFDRVCVPRRSWILGDIDIHDVKTDAAGRPIFVNTLYSCLATVTDEANFLALWKPPFISRLAPEDRCHLNGLAMKDGRAAYVTAVSRTDIADGWREGRPDQGVVVDVQKNAIVAEGLAMPHSPRWRNGELWVLNSGHGELGRINLTTGAFEPFVFLPGYLRGLTFSGNFALVGSSLPRRERTFKGLPYEQKLDDMKAAPRCGVFVVDLATGDVAHWLRFEGAITELFDVGVFAGARRAAAVGFNTEELRRLMRVAIPAPAQGQAQPAAPTPPKDDVYG
ncbi:MAG: TIGR03032 family protein [Maricaulaceae bacterium]